MKFKIIIKNYERILFLETNRYFSAEERGLLKSTVIYNVNHAAH